MYPFEGSIYNWTYRAFSLFNPSIGAFMSFFIGTCAWLPGLLSIVSVTDVIVSCLQTLNSAWLQAPWQQGLVIIAVVLVTGVISTQPRQTVQHILRGAFYLTGLLVGIVVLFAVVWLLKGHHSATNFADISGWQMKQFSRLFLRGRPILPISMLTMKCISPPLLLFQGKNFGGATKR